MSEPLVIPCPHCNGLNRLPAARLGDAPKCGRCKQDVLLSTPFDLTERSYASQIKGDLPLLVDVWADWCGPCKSFAPTFEQAARQLSGRCRLAKLDSEANRNLAGQLGIRSIPSLTDRLNIHRLSPRQSRHSACAYRRTSPRQYRLDTASRQQAGTCYPRY
ncbi:thioredoxin domain-containing protein [Enterobacterales bacterium BD_CKDN230030183-1A_HGKHYDSX7]